MSTLTRVASALAAAAGASEGVRLAGWKASLHLTVESTASPETLAALVRAVEREPEFVPGVRRVTVFARGGPCQPGDDDPRNTDVIGIWQDDQSGAEPTRPDGWVSYEVEGIRFGIPWRVRFRKCWEGDTSFVWWSEGGTGRPEHHGSLTLTEHDGRTHLELWAETRSALPVLGGLGTLLVNPLFLAPTFEGWLWNLVQRAEADGAYLIVQPDRSQ
jgi:hypothetical protein